MSDDKPNVGMADTLFSIFGFRRIEPGDPDYIPVYTIEGSGVVMVRGKEADDGTD